mmetsp:Transcript_6814/g.25153  ORF Transcript_6814/g.25153 Transcript_6814/m.25153 type:complete len:275 (+) Transcript_6814:1064-1888(+)
MISPICPAPTFCRWTPSPPTPLSTRASRATWPSWRPWTFSRAPCANCCWRSCCAWWTRTSPARTTACVRIHGAPSASRTARRYWRRASGFPTGCSRSCGSWRAATSPRCWPLAASRRWTAWRCVALVRRWWRSSSSCGRRTSGARTTMIPTTTRSTSRKCARWRRRRSPSGAPCRRRPPPARPGGVTPLNPTGAPPCCVLARASWTTALPRSPRQTASARAPAPVLRRTPRRFSANRRRLTPCCARSSTSPTARHWTIARRRSSSRTSSSFTRL